VRERVFLSSGARRACDDARMRIFLVASLVLMCACDGSDSPGSGLDASVGEGDGDGASGDGDGAAGDGDGASGDGDDAPGPDGGSGGMGTSKYFPAGSFFLEDVSDAPKASYSDATIASLRASGGWGNDDVFQIDFSIDVLEINAGTEYRSFTQRTEDNGFEWDEFYSPDCDELPMPLPAGGNVEGHDDYACESDGDCHLIAYDPEAQHLYEAWRVDLQGSELVSGCLVRWDTSMPVRDEGRGLQCTSADAAGFPIAALLFTADEVAAGEIEHAIRFILPNDRVRRGFVPPATHGSDTEGTGDDPYYGVHLRLRQDYPLETLPNDGARVVARALQRYGMYHADGGNIALTAQSDRHTTAKWEWLLGPHDLTELTVEDFEVIDHGDPIELTYQCERTPLR
jgi:hypothetical protein